MPVSLELLFQLTNTFLVMLMPIILVLVFVSIFMTIRSIKNKFIKHR